MEFYLNLFPTFTTTVYVLLSLKDNATHVGMVPDAEKRLVGNTILEKTDIPEDICEVYDFWPEYCFN